MLGMYYDDPNQVKNKTNMRAVVGFIIKPSNDAQRELIKSQFVKYGYKYMNIDKPTKCLFAKFDIKPPRTVAYMVSPAQFYRQVDEFIWKHKKLRNMMALSTTKNMWGVELYNEECIYFHKPLENFHYFDLTEHEAPKVFRQSIDKKVE